MTNRSSKKKFKDRGKKTKRTIDNWSDRLEWQYDPGTPLSALSVKTEVKCPLTDYVSRVTVYEDWSEEFTYPDEVVIVSRWCVGQKVVGKYLKATKWRDKVHVVFENEFGEAMRLELPESTREYNDSFDKIWAERTNIQTRLHYTSNLADRGKLEEERERLELELKSLEARNHVCDSMLTLFLGGKPLADLFTVQPLKGSLRKHQSSAKRKEISLQDAKDKIDSQCNRSGRQESRIDLCRCLLKTHFIIGKPNYTAEQLSNLVAHIVPSIPKPKKDEFT